MHSLSDHSGPTHLSPSSKGHNFTSSLYFHDRGFQQDVIEGQSNLIHASKVSRDCRGKKSVIYFSPMTPSSFASQIAGNF